MYKLLIVIAILMTSVVSMMLVSCQDSELSNEELESIYKMVQTEVENQVSAEIFYLTNDVNDTITQEVASQLSGLNDTVSSEVTTQLAGLDSKVTQEVTTQLSGLDSIVSEEVTNQLANYDNEVIQALESELDSLQVSYSALQSDYQQLEDERDNIENDYDTLIDWYYNINQEVNQRHGLWDDKQLFITPYDDDIENKVQEITGGFSDDVNEMWADFKRLYDWVVTNIEYNADTRLPYLPLVNGDVFWRQEYWRMPSETIEDGVGDCEDMAVLLASMILNYTYSAGYPCWCIGWTSDESAHMAVAFPVAGDQLTILDPAGYYYTGSYYLGSDDIAVAVDDWLAHWQPEPGIHVDCVFSDTVYETFDTTEEFVDWAIAR